MTHGHLDSSDRIGERRGTRQRLTYQARYPRPQGVVEALDVRDFPSQCADRAGLRRGNPACVDDVVSVSPVAC